MRCANTAALDKWHVPAWLRPPRLFPWGWLQAMDAASLRRLLLGRGLPASGKISKLRERLREARDG